ncbi:MAG: helix-hairpin-helix domain-containing protein, partial [Saprospiraceae bacterium]|nr:helix-hairpin-helix domain-containing protein [Saprospiraceae bacterium]
MRILVSFCIFFLLCTSVQAQETDSIDFQQWSIPYDWIESFLQDTDSEGTFDFNTFFDQLDLYINNPLNLNAASEEDLHELGLLSDVQIINFLNYRRQAGALIELYELQAVQGFDMQTIRRILPFVDLDAKSRNFQKSIGSMLVEGQNEIYLRWNRFLEDQRGYRSDISSPYEGDPNQLYFRYRHRFSNKLSYGITAEKDRGEAFFAGSNQQGFDFYSAHFFLREYTPWLKSLALGDYSVNLGQGLLIFTGFSRGKGAQVASIKKTGQTLRPYTSVNEVNFMRGAGTTLQFGNFEVTGFYSFQQLDGRLILEDTTDLDEDLRFISSIDRSGLHRTASEIAKENSTELQTIGGSLKYKTDRGHIAFNILHNQLNGDLSRPDAPYALFRFAGNSLLGMSADYSFIYRNLNFFGETAYSENGAIATLN